MMFGGISMVRFQSLLEDQERYDRRLSDKIYAAFNHACDESDDLIAAQLLQILELLLLRKPPDRDRRETVLGTLLISHERLWSLKHLHDKNESVSELAGSEA
jgi:hypothetical protein